MIRASLMLRSLVILCTLFFVFAPFSFEMGSIADGVVALQENTALAQSPTTGLLGEDNVITIWSIIKGEHSFVDVFSILIYWIIAYPLFYITRAVAMVLDIMLFLSVSSSTYSSLLFIREGWEIVRDIANIGFIFALLYVAIGLTLDLQQVNVKKLLVNIVIVALLINFSLFFARVIVDAGNILARVFYNNITVIDTGDFDQSIIGAGQDPVKNVSAAIMAKVRPQALLSKDLYNAPIGANGIMPSSTEKALLNLFVILLLIIVYIALLGAFVTVSVLFLVRIVSIAISMILAPLAFATLMFPGASGISRIGFSSWIGELVKISFMAPVFIFFLYIILRFLSIDTFISVTPGATFWVQIMQVVIPLAILIGLIYAAKNIATKMSGEMGEKAAGFAGKVSSAIGGVTVGAGLAVATGGAALAAQSTIGRAGNALANSDFAKGMIRSDSAWIQKAGMSLQSAGKKAATSSFDWRQTSLGQKAVAATGLNTMGAENAFAGASIGGYTGAQERKEKSKIEREKAITEAAEVKKGDKERKDLDLAEKERDKLNQTEQQLNTKYATELEYFAKAIADAREKMKDAGTPAEKAAAAKELNTAKTREKAFKAGRRVNMSKNGVITQVQMTGDTHVDANGVSQAVNLKSLSDMKQSNQTVIRSEENRINGLNAGFRQNQAKAFVQKENIKNAATNIAVTIVSGVAGAAAFIPQAGAAMKAGQALTTIGAVAGVGSGAAGVIDGFSTASQISQRDEIRDKILNKRYGTQAGPAPRNPGGAPSATTGGPGAPTP